MLPKPMLRMQRMAVLLLTAILVGMVIHPIHQIDSSLSEEIHSSNSSAKAGSTDWTAVAGYDTVTTPSIQVEAGLVSPTDVAIDSLGSVYTGGFAIYDVKFGGQQYSATDQLAFVAKTYNKMSKTIMSVYFHNMPDDWLRPNFYKRLWLKFCLF